MDTGAVSISKGEQCRHMPVVSDVAARQDGVMYINELNCDQWCYRGRRRKLVNKRGRVAVGV